jgi:hypothetical protein
MIIGLFQEDLKYFIYLKHRWEYILGQFQEAYRKFKYTLYLQNVQVNFYSFTYFLKIRRAHE